MTSEALFHPPSSPEDGLTPYKGPLSLGQQELVYDMAVEEDILRAQGADPARIRSTHAKRWPAIVRLAIRNPVPTTRDADRDELQPKLILGPTPGSAKTRSEKPKSAGLEDRDYDARMRQLPPGDRD